MSLQFHRTASTIHVRQSPCQAKVTEFYVRALVDQNVTWLQVPMQNIGLFQKVEGAERIIGNGYHVTLGEFGRLHALYELEQVVFDVLHNEEEVLELLALVVAHGHDHIVQFWCVALVLIDFL